MLGFYSFLTSSFGACYVHKLNILIEWQMSSHLFKLVVDDLGLLVSLEPHHVLGVKPPALLLERLRG